LRQETHPTWQEEGIPEKINDLQTETTNMKYIFKSINGFKRCYQPESNSISGENGDLANSHKISNRCKNFFCCLLTVHDVNDVRQSEIYTADLLMPRHISFWIEIPIEKMKRHK
jgi:hypothetical protein